MTRLEEFNKGQFVRRLEALELVVTCKAAHPPPHTHTPKKKRGVLDVCGGG